MAELLLGTMDQYVTDFVLCTGLEPQLIVQQSWKEIRGKHCDVCVWGLDDDSSTSFWSVFSVQNNSGICLFVVRLKLSSGKDTILPHTTSTTSDLLQKPPPISNLFPSLSSNFDLLANVLQRKHIIIVLFTELLKYLTHRLLCNWSLTKVDIDLKRVAHSSVFSFFSLDEIWVVIQVKYNINCWPIFLAKYRCGCFKYLLYKISKRRTSIADFKDGCSLFLNATT